MTSQEIEQQITQYRTALEDARARKVKAKDRKAFGDADAAITELTRDIEFAEMRLAQARQAEAEAKRKAALERLAPLREELIPINVQSRLLPLLEDLAKAHRAHAAATERVQALAAEVSTSFAAAKALATELGAAPLVDPTPLEFARFELARSLVGAPTINLQWLVVPRQESELFALACGIYGAKPWRPDENLQTLDEYDHDEQLEAIVAGTHAQNVADMNRIAKARQAELQARADGSEARKERRIREIMAEQGYTDEKLRTCREQEKRAARAHAERVWDIEARETASENHAQVIRLMKKGATRFEAMRQVHTNPSEPEVA
jgi:hypothetical protein